MHKQNFYISFGIWIAILPFLGVPIVWKSVLVTLSGLFLILVALGPSILKKLQSKPKSKKKPSELRFSEEAPVVENISNSSPDNNLTP